MFRPLFLWQSSGHKPQLIRMLSFYDNCTVCDFTILKLAMITINRINNNEISLNFRSI